MGQPGAGGGRGRALRGEGRTHMLVSRHEPDEAPIKVVDR